jgi:type II secretory ATPase GspE/PulE/Tfp pilus assembly ATPase PilB-like protein
MLSNDALRGLIRHRASGTELRQNALAAGMKTLRQDGIEKMLQGLTDLSEVLAATNLGRRAAANRCRIQRCTDHLHS